MKDFNGEEIKYVYDEAGSLLRKELLSLGTSVSYGYDEETRTETIVSARGTTVYKYDESGRLLSRQDPEGPYIDGDGASLEYVYDENRVTLKTSHREIVYEYNEDGSLKSVTTPEGTTEYRYEDGVLVKTIFPNGTAEVIVYDPLGRIDVIKTVKIDPVTEEELGVLASYDYEVDDAGNREEVIDHNGRKVEYEYDELNRVAEEKISNPLDASEDGRTITYVYDAVGNLDYKGDTLAGDTDFVYNHLNQLVRSTLGGVETVYTYDNNGSLKTRTTGEKSITYHWENDGENRLKGVDIVEGGLTTDIDYEYNEQGIRVGKKVNDVETSYLIDELQPYAQVLEEYDTLGNLQNAYVYGNDLVSKSDNNETLFYHVDGLGSTRVLTDESGNIEESYNYDAYGNLITGNSVENAYLFAGEQRDIETGLDYLRARYYDPALRRFISRDAYGGSSNDPMSQHKYQYAHANPVVNTDPSGYVTNLMELAALAAMTATPGGLGLTTVGAIGTGLNGGSTSDVLSTYDQFFAGMVDSLTFGISTQARKFIYGEQATQNHRGMFFNLGRLGGAVASMWVGASAPTFAKLSSAPWWARAALGYDLFGTGLGMIQSTINIFHKKATWWDILSFLPLATWFNINYKVTTKGLSFGSNGANIDIQPRGGGRPVQIITNKIDDADSTLWRPKHLEGVTIIDGKLFIKDQPLHAPNHFDTEFVIGLDGNIIFGQRHQHLAKIAGDKLRVQAAGTMNVKVGKISAIDNNSGHFLPTLEETLNYPQLFNNLGIDLKDTRLRIWAADELGNPYLATEVILQ